jgi:hypothetical protein
LGRSVGAVLSCKAVARNHSRRIVARILAYRGMSVYHVSIQTKVQLDQSCVHLSKSWSRRVALRYLMLYRHGRRSPKGSKDISIDDHTDHTLSYRQLMACHGQKRRLRVFHTEWEPMARRPIQLSKTETYLICTTLTLSLWRLGWGHFVFRQVITQPSL